MTEIGILAIELANATTRVATLVGISEAEIKNGENEMHIVASAIAGSGYLDVYLRARIVLLRAVSLRSSNLDFRLEVEITRLDDLMGALRNLVCADT